MSVSAANAVGAGPESAGVTLTVPAVAPPPGNPTNLGVAVSGASATFTWNAPAAGGAPSGYTLIAGTSPGIPSPIASMPLPATPRSVAIGGIPPGTYYARVLATNAGGASGPSNEVMLTVAGAAAPAAPVLNTPSVSGRTVSLSWSAGGGGAPTGYTLLASVAPGGAPIATVPVTGTGVTLPGVPPGTYYLRLTASNPAGTSAPSNQVVLVVP